MPNTPHPHAIAILVRGKKKPPNPKTQLVECCLYVYAHLLAGKPDLDLPWDPDLQQEKNKAQQSSQ